MCSTNQLKSWWNWNRFCNCITNFVAVATNATDVWVGIAVIGWNTTTSGPEGYCWIVPYCSWEKGKSYYIYTFIDYMLILHGLLSKSQLFACQLWNHKCLVFLWTLHGFLHFSYMVVISDLVVCSCSQWISDLIWSRKRNRQRWLDATQIDHMHTSCMHFYLAIHLKSLVKLSHSAGARNGQTTYTLH